MGLQHSLIYEGTLSLGGFALDASGPARSCSEQSGSPMTRAAPRAVCSVFTKIDCRPPPCLILVKKVPPYGQQERAAFYSPPHERG